MNLQPATEPTFYFVGVTTGKSSIMRVFPEWARHLGVSETIKGIDCKWHDDPEVYREVVSFLKHDALSLGALVTTHKIDLLKAARDLFDELDSYAELMGEVSCISKRNGRLIGHAKDPITSGLSLEAFLPADHWKQTGADLFCIGAGGSSIALTSYLMEKCAPDNRPARIIVSNRSTPRPRRDSAGPPRDQPRHRDALPPLPDARTERRVVQRAAAGFARGERDRTRQGRARFRR
jgi:shikimate 5-dehydrogenase